MLKINTLDLDWLRSLGLPEDYYNYFSQFPTLQEGWDNCEDARYMLRLLFLATPYRRGDETHKRLVSVTNAVARTALPCKGKCEKATKKCLDTTDKWCRGEASIKEVRAAAYAANAAIYATYAATYAAYAAANAAYAAANAADATYAATYAANAAANAAYAAANANAADAAYTATYKQYMKKCCDVIRLMQADAPFTAKQNDLNPENKYEKEDKKMKTYLVLVWPEGIHGAPLTQAEQEIFQSIDDQTAIKSSYEKIHGSGLLSGTKYVNFKLFCLTEVPTSRQKIKR